MTSFPQPQRQEGSAVSDADLAALLSGAEGAAPGLWPVADILAALTADPSAAELAAEGRALAEFRRRTGAPARRRAQPRTAALTSRLGTKLGAAAAGVSLVLAGAATASFANVLPAPIQRLAHETIGAPSPRPGHRPGPAAPGVPAGHGRPMGHGTRGDRSHSLLHDAPHGPGKHGRPHAHGQQGTSHGSGHASGQGGSQSQSSGQSQVSDQSQGSVQGQAGASSGQAVNDQWLGIIADRGGRHVSRVPRRTTGSRWHGGSAPGPARPGGGQP
jgi:hypothetical protein